MMAVTFAGETPSPTFGKPSMKSAPSGSGPAHRIVPRTGPTDGHRFLAATLVDDAPERRRLTVIVNWRWRFAQAEQIAR
jgi:hypothetical protein